MIQALVNNNDNNGSSQTIWFLVKVISPQNGWFDTKRTVLVSGSLQTIFSAAIFCGSVDTPFFVTQFGFPMISQYFLVTRVLHCCELRLKFYCLPSGHRCQKAHTYTAYTLSAIDLSTCQPGFLEFTIPPSPEPEP